MCPPRGFALSHPAMSDETGDVVKMCRNPDCTGINPVKGNWCTARECKALRALGTAAKKQHKMATACAAVGVAVPAALPSDVGQCYALHSVHGVLDCDFPHLGGKALEKAPPDDPKELRFLVGAAPKRCSTSVTSREL